MSETATAAASDGNPSTSAEGAEALARAKSHGEAGDGSADRRPMKATTLTLSDSANRTVLVATRLDDAQRWEIEFKDLLTLGVFCDLRKESLLGVREDEATRAQIVELLSRFPFLACGDTKEWVTLWETAGIESVVDPARFEAAGRLNDSMATRKAIFPEAELAESEEKKQLADFLDSCGTESEEERAKRMRHAGRQARMEPPENGRGWVFAPQGHWISEAAMHGDFAALEALAQAGFDMSIVRPLLSEELLREQKAAIADNPHLAANDDIALMFGQLESMGVVVSSLCLLGMTEDLMSHSCLDLDAWFERRGVKPDSALKAERARQIGADFAIAARRWGVDIESPAPTGRGWWAEAERVASGDELARLVAEREAAELGQAASVNGPSAGDEPSETHAETGARQRRRI
jgi:hypothetical protein